MVNNYVNFGLSLNSSSKEGGACTGGVCALFLTKSATKLLLFFHTTKLFYAFLFHPAHFSVVWRFLRSFLSNFRSASIRRIVSAAIGPSGKNI